MKINSNEGATEGIVNIVDNIFIVNNLFGTCTRMDNYKVISFGQQKIAVLILVWSYYWAVLKV